MDDNNQTRDINNNSRRGNIVETIETPTSTIHIIDDDTTTTSRPARSTDRSAERLERITKQTRTTQDTLQVPGGDELARTASINSTNSTSQASQRGDANRGSFEENTRRSYAEFPATPPPRVNPEPEVRTEVVTPVTTTTSSSGRIANTPIPPRTADEEDEEKQTIMEETPK